MMGNRRLRQLNALLDVSATKTPSIALGFPALCSILQHLQNPAPGRIGDGMQRPVKQFVVGHMELQIPAKLMNVNVMNASTICRGVTALVHGRSGHAFASIPAADLRETFSGSSVSNRIR